MGRSAGIVKGIFGPLYGEAKTCSTHVQYRGCKDVKPSQQNSSSSTTVSFRVHQERVMGQPNRKVSVMPEASSVHHANSYGSVAVDEHIDRKASIYISSVQERFRLEGLIN